MEDTSDLVHIFCNTQLTVNHLKNILAENGITSLIKNDYESGNAAGFVAGTSANIDLYVQKVDGANAKDIVEKFKASLQE